MIRYVKEFFSPILSTKKEAVKLVSVALALPVMSMFGAYSVKILTDALSNKQMDIFLHQLILMGIVAAICIGIVLALKNCYIDFSEDAEQWIFSKYSKKFILMDNTKYESLGTGRFIEIMTKGQQSWSSLLVSVLENMLSSFFMIGLGLLNVYIIDPRLFYIFSGIMIIITTIVVILNEYIKKHRFAYKEKHIETMRHYVRILNSKFEILQNDRLQYELDKIKAIRNEARKIMYSIMSYIESMFTSGRVFVWGARIFMIYIIGYAIYQGTVGLGSLAGLVTALGIMDYGVTNFIGHYKNFIKSFTDVSKLWDTFEKTGYINGYTGLPDFNFIKGDIELKNMSFGYGEKKVFENFNLKIKGKSKIAFVGKSGAGKTTLAKIIAGYVFPQEGQVIIDNQVMAEFSLKSYYKHLGYLTQESSVFDGTIKENLLYGMEHISDEDLKSAINMAECQFIYGLEKGLDTEIGDRGVKLSGGQKQRIAIAKIFIKNPEIIILDEPTSALDSESEDKISKAIHNLMSGRTVITIAHRLQTVRECDKIFVIGKNEVIEEGTHDELVKLGGNYSKMVNLQSGSIEE